MNSPTADAAAIQLFNLQHRLAHVTQLSQLGLSKDQVAYRVKKGIYSRDGHGVVALGTPPRTLQARAMRAVLTLGAGAAAALWTAAELHALDAPRDKQLHAVVLGNRRRGPTSALYAHRTRYLPATHVTKVHAVPTTSLGRTVVDCSSRLDRWASLRLLDSVSASASTWREIHLTAVELSNGRAGVHAIVEATAPDGADRLRSTFERIARDVLRARRVPDGRWNEAIADELGRIREVDLVYPEARLIVEFDGLRFHRGPSAEQRDRAADRRLQTAGWRVLRFTWDDLVRRPGAVANDIMRALSR